MTLDPTQTDLNAIDVLAIGEILVDFISSEPAERLLDASAFRRHAGGSPANLAVNIARLGGRAALVAKVGKDAFGQFLKNEIERSGVITDTLVIDPKVLTSLVFVSQTSGTPDFQPYRDADFKLTPEDISPEIIGRARVLHTSTWPLSRQPSRSAVFHALVLAQEAGKIISFDPNYSPLVWPDRDEALEVMRQVYRYVTITKASLDDAGRFFGPGRTPQEYIQMFHELGPKTVVFTLGKDGSMVSDEGRLVSRIPARPIKVVDATGAGDSFWAGFLVALLDGSPLEKCLMFAREVVELKLQTVGTLPARIDRAELYSRL